MYKTLETAGIWVCINNLMSVIGCTQNTGIRHSVPVYRVVSQKPNRSKVGDSCITEVCTLGSKYGSVGAYLKQKVKEYTTMAD